MFPFRDRVEAGRMLATTLQEYANRGDVIVLALPRGGVPVGFEVAKALHAPLDVFVVRKLGLPGQEELAMGAIASGGVRVLNSDLLLALRIPEEVVGQITQEANLQIRAIRENARSTIGSRYDYDPLVELAGNSRFALLGEASHGTRDFYQTRLQITQRLIEEKGYTAVAVEADWPDAYRINRYVQGRGEDADAVEALGSFKRFPTWMWRNTDVVEFIAWLREYNDALPEGRRKVGFYGLDL